MTHIDPTRLVQDIVNATGATPPALLDADAPVLSEATRTAGLDGLYFVGLIGGKEVGKSALVNALVGQRITESTSFGPGTSQIIAYAHESAQAELRTILDREAPGQYRLVTHRIDALSRQVLLDLPDIDSHYQAHLDLVRRMLHLMLYPVWVQSIEKYADARARQLLAAVAQGNDPRNFIFCLNKIDLVTRHEGATAANELAEDYAHRLAQTLRLDPAPRVWMVSATQPDQGDLRELRQRLSQQKSRETVDQSRHWAGRQLNLSLLAWIDQQQLPHQADQLQRLSDDVEQQIDQRLAGPLQPAIGRLPRDPAWQSLLSDAVLRRRVTHWPIVSILHTVLEPLFAVVRRRLPLARQYALEGADALVDLHLRFLSDVPFPSDTAACLANRSDDATPSTTSGRSLSSRIRETFAAAHQANPLLGRLYHEHKLWEPMRADAAEADLRHRLAAVLSRQRDAIEDRLGGRSLSLLTPWRWLVTLGALLWFPLVQPLLEAALDPAAGRKTVLLLVQIMGVTYWLKNVSLLIVYYTAIWMILRWSTQTRVARRLARLNRDTGAATDPSLNLGAQVDQWLTDLSAPIARAQTQIGELVERTQSLRQETTPET